MTSCYAYWHESTVYLPLTVSPGSDGGDANTDLEAWASVRQTGVELTYSNVKEKTLKSLLAA